MSIELLRRHLNANALNVLQEVGWPLQQHADAWSRAVEAQAAGWNMFPLAAEFLSVFDGFSTEAEEELYIGAWKAIPLTAPHYAPLREQMRQTQLFPIGLAAGWVNILLREDGEVITVINGKPGRFYSQRTESTLSDVLISIASSKELNAWRPA